MIPFVYSSENLPTRERAQQPQRTRTVHQTRVQLASTQHFHDEVHRVRRLVDFVQLDNVRVVETTKNKHLLEESLSLGRVEPRHVHRLHGKLGSRLSTFKLRFLTHRLITARIVPVAPDPNWSDVNEYTD